MAYIVGVQKLLPPQKLRASSIALTGIAILILTILPKTGLALQPLNLDGQSCYQTEPNCVGAPYIYEEATLRQTFINKCTARVYIRVCYQDSKANWQCSAHGINRDKSVDITTPLPVNGSFLRVVGSLLPINDQACAEKQKDWLLLPEKPTS